MITIEQAQSIIHRLTYKPGWKFHLDFYTVDKVSLAISFDTENAYEPGQIVKIGFRQVLTPSTLISEESFIAALMSIIDRAERHETREWFKIDGQMPFDPHKGGSFSF